ncbi:hypothetical protein NDU88_002904 [Pleurodeles waltl]|uniref:Uncharacterized protein n=1 Tax=Pleurodeles waltl TaxID=8319 RepID=A0AAV7MU44_PLEWA|nr:hypothetical protein NDU88_002904 [Pleurodeles waltl]
MRIRVKERQALAVGHTGCVNLQQTYVSITEEACMHPRKLFAPFQEKVLCSSVDSLMKFYCCPHQCGENQQSTMIDYTSRVPSQPSSLMTNQVTKHITLQSIEFGQRCYWTNKQLCVGLIFNNFTCLMTPLRPRTGTYWCWLTLGCSMGLGGRGTSSSSCAVYSGDSDTVLHWGGVVLG